MHTFKWSSAYFHKRSFCIKLELSMRVFFSWPVGTVKYGIESLAWY